eukprot:jgi/Botrbrau1/1857/Bobra.146_1s0046.2
MMQEAFYGKKVVVADREMVETGADAILKIAKAEDVAFLVVGDPFGATTHTDLQLRARDDGVPVQVIHNASVMNAVGACGLQLYRFGEAISMVFFTESWQPDSFYPKLLGNRQRGLHTLCLLDIKVKEPTLESLARGKPKYEPPRYMTVGQAITQLLLIEEERREGAVDTSTLCVGLARLGADNQAIVAGPLSEVAEVDLGPPLHCLVIPGDLHEVEKEFLSQFMLHDSLQASIPAS